MTLAGEIDEELTAAFFRDLAVRFRELWL